MNCWTCARDSRSGYRELELRVADDERKVKSESWLGRVVRPTDHLCQMRERPAAGVRAAASLFPVAGWP